MEKNMNYNLLLAQNREVETKRLLLRPITLHDIEDMFEYASDEETTEYVFPAQKTRDETADGIANYFMKDPLGKYGIELKETGKMIGSIDLRVNEANQSGEIGYVINKKYWGQGLVPEAGEALLQLGFEKLKLVRIEATHDQDNPKSGRVMEKLGMKQEGICPNARICKGKIVTEVIRGMTIQDWKHQQANK